GAEPFSFTDGNKTPGGGALPGVAHQSRSELRPEARQRDVDPAETPGIGGDRERLRVHRHKTSLIVKRRLQRHGPALGRADRKDARLDAKRRLTPRLDLLRFRERETQLAKLGVRHLPKLAA